MAQKQKQDEQEETNKEEGKYVWTFTKQFEHV